MGIVHIDKKKIESFAEANGLTMRQMSIDIGRSTNYIKNAASVGRMSPTTYEFLIKTYGVPYDTFLQSTEDRMNAEHEQHQTKPQTGYGINLKYTPTTVRVAITLNGGEVVKAWAKIVDDSELGFVKAISYAAHLCYKFAEQNQLQNSIEE